ncbi:MAG: 7-carboxy-7-deazaguanine synthase QueE, partial [Flammeovirgaceae bacterium]|nr:7-carboxy-7-deazaguanine synthase QueE [Flammeovirgaceae bacterium]MDW8288984.1 7-carboxy-7-deazaguanine synthase QueE [Flammeovirgaceae bacterium]
PQVNVEHIVAEALKYPSRKVVITGGEPLIHDLRYLTENLKKAGFTIHIETSGVYPVSGELDWICFSPKKFKKPLPAFYHLAHELKVVVYHPSDLAWAEDFAQKMNPHCHLFLQPEWGRQEEIMPLIVDHVKQHPHWRISLQTHKFMNIP